MTNFFTAQLPPIIGELHIAQIAHYAELIQAMENVSSCSYFIIDYQKRTFAYIPDNSQFLCGHKKEEVMQHGLTHYSKITKEKEAEQLKEANRIAFTYFQQIPLEKRKGFTLEYNFCMLNKNGASCIVKHKQTPIVLTNTGDIWLSLCSIQPSSTPSNEMIRLKNKKENEEFTLNWKTKSFVMSTSTKLSIKETEMLQMLASGLTENQISEQLFISPNTVKYHKKSIVKKLNVSTIKEAIYRYVAY